MSVCICLIHVYIYMYTHSGLPFLFFSYISSSFNLLSIYVSLLDVTCNCLGISLHESSSEILIFTLPEISSLPVWGFEMKHQSIAHSLKKTPLQEKLEFNFIWLGLWVGGLLGIFWKWVFADFLGKESVFSKAVCHRQEAMLFEMKTSRAVHPGQITSNHAASRIQFDLSQLWSRRRRICYPPPKPSHCIEFVESWVFLNFRLRGCLASSCHTGEINPTPWKSPGGFVAYLFVMKQKSSRSSLPKVQSPALPSVLWPGVSKLVPQILAG